MHSLIANAFRRCATRHSKEICMLPFLQLKALVVKRGSKSLSLPTCGECNLLTQGFLAPDYDDDIGFVMFNIILVCISKGKRTLVIWACYQALSLKASCFISTLTLF